MTPEKRQRAEAIKTLIHLGWNPPAPNNEQAGRIIDDICALSTDMRGQQARCDSLDLTAKERAVLELLADGHTTDSAAERMHYSNETIKSYMKRIRQKLGAKNTAHAVAIAYRAGELDLRRAA